MGRPDLADGVRRMVALALGLAKLSDPPLSPGRGVVGLS